MWSYYFDRDLVTLEVLKISIEDAISFDAELLELGFNEDQVHAVFDRELTSLEEDEVSGYVMSHTAAGIVTKGKFQVKSYNSHSDIEKISFFANLEGEDNYNTKFKEITYYYNSSNQATYFIEEKFDLLEQVYRRQKYNIYSDPVTGKVMIEEE